MQLQLDAKIEQECLKAQIENYKQQIRSFEEQSEAILKKVHPLKQAKTDLLELQSYMGSLMHMSMVYLSASNDKVDKLLASQINSKQRDKSRLFFVRESPGIYRYNGKKVVVKMEKMQLVFKTKAGNLSLDEFIEEFGP